MRFVIKKAAFLNAIEKASATVSAHDHDPILKTLNIEADPDQVRLLSTDLSLGSIARIKVVDVKEEGAICVPAQKLTSIIRSAEETDIDFKIEEKQAVLKAARAVWKINVLESTEYPEVPRFDPENAEEVPREKLLDVIQKVRYAASTDEVRPSLMLIAFNGTRAATADGSRLQCATFEGLEGVQIPIFAVNNLVRLLSRTEVETVKVERKKNHLLFQIGADTFSTQRLYEEFPDVEGLILKPAEKNDQELTLDKEALLAAINRVKIAASEDRKRLDIEVLEPENGSGPSEVLLQAEDDNGELATETLGCSTTLAPGRKIHVNHIFFTDALNMTPAKQVTLKLGNDGAKRRSSIFMEEGGLKSVLLQLRPEE